MSNLLQPTEIFVPKYLKLQEILDEHERGHWIAEEMDMRLDCEQWKNGIISDEEKSYIKNILRLFTQADTDVCTSYVNRLLQVFKNADARMMLLSFANREVTHMKAYKRLNDTLGYDSEAFMSEFLSFKEMKDKHDFMIEDVLLNTPSEIALYLAKQILMEGVNLFGSFAMLLSFSQEGKLPGMVSGNQWSIGDESLHVNGLTTLFNIFIEENPSVVNNHFKAIIYETARKVVALEDLFIDLVYKTGNNKNAQAEGVKAYVRYVCDYRMQQMGLKPQFGIRENPLPWIDLITSNTFANFFEATSVQYSKNSMDGDWVY
jgi:ribonucleoside-diphosphate reductase beta chain